MNLERTKTLIRAKSGHPLVGLEPSALSELTEHNGNPDVRQYLEECLTTAGFMASGVRVAGVERLVDEHVPGASPGSHLFGRGYVIFATSIGGNAICVDREGSVWWANHSSFLDDQVSYETSAGSWLEEEISDESVRRALIRLDDSFEPFLNRLLEDELEASLDSLD